MEEDNSDLSNEIIEEENENSKENSNEEKNEIDSDQKNSDKISEEELNSFNTKLHTIQKGINTLKSKFNSLIENMKREDYELQYGLSFFESKQDMMNIFCIMAIFLRRLQNISKIQTASKKFCVGFQTFANAILTHLTIQIINMLMAFSESNYQINTIG